MKDTAFSDGPYIAEAAALIGDPARANILIALMDGRALTATELAHAARVSAQTTSSHLAKLAAAHLIKMERQGRHRYFRLAGTQVAQAIEALSVLSVGAAPRHRPIGPKDQAMRFARTCYDHLAGHLGVTLAWRLVELGHLDARDDDFTLTPGGETALGELGLEIPRLRRSRRRLTRPCLDWSERRPHLAGSLGAALLGHMEGAGWLKRVRDTRAIHLTQAGREGLADSFGLSGL